MAISRLFNIEPIGVGTPYVESLPSYIKRLAEAHSVFPGVLLKHEIFPETRDYPLDTLLPNQNKLLFSIISDITNDLIRVLEIKTNNNHIHNISLSRLSRFINSKDLFRDHAAWCPLCFEEARKNNEPAYEQLIWSIKDIKICGKHGSRLYYICPHCQKQIKHYHSFGRVGYCYHCKSWLGLDNLNGNSYNKLNKWDIWVFGNVGSILSIMPNLNLSSDTYLSRNIQDILNITGLTKDRLGKEISVSESAITVWTYKNKKPSLSAVLLLGYKFGLTVSGLLLERIDCKNINTNYHQKESIPERPYIGLNELHLAIKKALLSAEPISINWLSEKYEVPRETIINNFPTEYHMLIQKYKRQKEEQALEREAQIRDKMISLNETGLFPSIYRITRELGMYGILSKRYRKIWENTLQELGYTDKIDSENTQ